MAAGAVAVAGGATRYCHIVAVPQYPAEVVGEGAVTAVHPPHQDVFVVVSVVAHFSGAVEVIHLFQVNTVIDNVDYPADGPGAEAQGGGAPQDLDAVGEQGFAADGVIGADIGGVGDAGAVVENLDPLAAEAANHGCAHTGAEGAVVDSRLVLQGFAESRRHLPLQLLLVEDGDGTGNLIRALVVGRGGDDELVDMGGGGGDGVGGHGGADQGQR